MFTFDDGRRTADNGTMHLSNNARPCVRLACVRQTRNMTNPLTPSGGDTNCAHATMRGECNEIFDRVAREREKNNKRANAPRRISFSGVNAVARNSFIAACAIYRSSMARLERMPNLRAWVETSRQCAEFADSVSDASFYQLFRSAGLVRYRRPAAVVISTTVYRMTFTPADQWHTISRRTPRDSAGGLAGDILIVADTRVTAAVAATTPASASATTISRISVSLRTKLES